MNIRARRTKLFSSLDSLTDEDSSEHIPLEFGRQDPRLLLAADRLVLLRSFEELLAGYRIVFMLHDIEGYQHSEICGNSRRHGGE